MNPAASAVTKTAAAALVKQHLRGLPGDPQVPEAYERLTCAVADQAVSVDHARAALDCFQDQFPSPRELADTLYNLKSRFVDSTSRFLAGGFEELTARDFPTRNGAEFHDQVVATLRGAATADQFEQMKIEAVRDMLYYTEGAGRNEPHDRKYWEREVHRTLRDWPGLVAAVREGRSPTAEELHPHPERPRGTPSPIESSPLTEQDLEAARQRYEQEKAELQDEAERKQQRKEIEDAGREGNQRHGIYSNGDPT